MRLLSYSYYTSITGWGGPPEVFFRKGLGVHVTAARREWAG